MVSKHAKSVDLFLRINVLQTIMDLEICKSSMFVLQLCGKKEKPFLAIKKAKNRIFPKGLTHAFGPKNANFYFVSVKTRLVIVLLNDFVEKKETFLSIKKKKEFSKF